MAKTQTRRTTQEQEEPTKKQEQEEAGEAIKIMMKRKKKGLNRGAWTAEEDSKLAHVIQTYGPRRWQSIAAKAGLNRCGKSCRLRWMNYLRPNIKRGNISDQEEDLILRLHNLLGNRWSLIAGRIPGRTDNEIKNYWNSHLSKKLLTQEEDQIGRRNSARKPDPDTESRRRLFGQEAEMSKENARKTEKSNNRDEQQEEETDMDFNIDDFFDFSNENLEWVNRFLELDKGN